MGGKFGLAGRAGSRLLAALGIGISRQAALRVLLRITLSALEVPRVLGIDDFALRQGLVCATILIDAGTGTDPKIGPQLDALQRALAVYGRSLGLRAGVGQLAAGRGRLVQSFGHDMFWPSPLLCIAKRGYRQRAGRIPSSARRMASASAVG